MRVDVRKNNVDQALRILKKKLQQDGLFNELREREHFISKGEKRRRAKAAGRRRCLKEQQKRKEELGF
tara:strand:- start:1008 stop:1211 length:204 start_codon:yes stop_codon:yes gene_type:complete